ncbi:hypothetical protein [Ornithinimicrobium faecis]|uniref:Uncharacterized protein n=1 Tax=Ornithinimicrobium faecis TaxID=2934158 RepID=A0ABY4YVS5_9MICO|nr:MULTISPECIES: hypothetical protein [unclassified Ornithinimicrobium]USQ80863.1 hypothetical protein NF556_04200 [Ornithinimicrobium sp. HY1793]
MDTTTRGVEKHSVSMPPAISQEVLARVGARGFSAYIAAIMDRLAQ